MSIVSLLILAGVLLVPISLFALIMPTKKDNQTILYSMTCPKCKAKIEPEQIFCSTCGNKLK